jgi:hypothetical protein
MCGFRNVCQWKSGSTAVIRPGCLAAGLLASVYSHVSGRPAGEVAKSAGRLCGRPVKLTPEKRAAALRMRERGDMTMAQIARALGVGRTTLYEHLGDLAPLDGIDRGKIDELAA